jgi:hypothetical protein
MHEERYEEKRLKTGKYFSTNVLLISHENGLLPQEKLLVVALSINVGIEK